MSHLPETTATATGLASSSASPQPGEDKNRIEIEIAGVRRCKQSGRCRRPPRRLRRIHQRSRRLQLPLRPCARTVLCPPQKFIDAAHARATQPMPAAGERNAGDSSDATSCGAMAGDPATPWQQDVPDCFWDTTERPTGIRRKKNDTGAKSLDRPVACQRSVPRELEVVCHQSQTSVSQRTGAPSLHVLETPLGLSI